MNLILACHFVSGWISSRIQTLFSISTRQIQLTLACRLSHKRLWIRVLLPSTVWAKTRLLINFFSPRIFQSMDRYDFFLGTRYYTRIFPLLNLIDSARWCRRFTKTFRICLRYPTRRWTRLCNNCQCRILASSIRWLLSKSSTSTSTSTVCSCLKTWRRRIIAANCNWHNV